MEFFYHETMAASFPILNWKDCSRLVELYAFSLASARVEKLIVPTRTHFSAQFLKGEWALKLHTRDKQNLTFLFCVRPGRPYLALIDHHLKAANVATRSAFDLELSKRIEGKFIEKIEVVNEERAVLIHFNEGILCMWLVPAKAEALFLDRDHKILFRSRTVRDEKETHFKIPEKKPSDKEFQVHEEWVKDSATWNHTLSHALRQEAFSQRLKSLEAGLKREIEFSEKKLKELEQTEKNTKNDQPWKKYGDLFQIYLHHLPELKDGFIDLIDPESEEPLRVPIDPKLKTNEQLNRFYELAKRQERRKIETKARRENFNHKLKKARTRLAESEALKEEVDFKKLESLESENGVAAGKENKTTRKAPKESSFRVFYSTENQPIWVGRTKEENSEVTFRHAKGNDLWMHVKGKPGCHTVLPLSSGKSASLETLLDAAQLTLFYSGGEKWGKTEIDYTYRKYVKRIKDSEQVSYTQNKSLYVETDQKRLDRLLSSE